jgi:hypothetical protein
MRLLWLPHLATGKNLFFKKKHRQAKLVRVRSFMTTREVDQWRKVIEL